MAQIICDIDENGEVTMKVMGVQGKSCNDLTKEYEENLGVLTREVKTAEYYAETNKKTATVKI